MIQSIIEYIIQLDTLHCLLPGIELCCSVLSTAYDTEYHRVYIIIQLDTLHCLLPGIELCCSVLSTAYDTVYDVYNIMVKCVVHM